MASTRFGDNGVPIERLDVSAYTVPADFPESDDTIQNANRSCTKWKYTPGTTASKSPGRPLAPIRPANYPPMSSATRSVETKGNGSPIS